MRCETFTGRDVASVHQLARRALGDDAMILETSALEGPTRGIRIVAAPAEDLEQLMSLVRPRANGSKVGVGVSARPRVIALVGPTGAGKTTTIAKLATHAEAYGARRVGLLTLDTHRAAGFEQLQAYADAAGLPCHIAYDIAEAQAAMKKLAACDVVLVDTAGRGPAHADSQRISRGILAALRPDEVHLCVPATLRLDLLEKLRADHAALRPSHAILTKLDEVPADRTLGEIASRLKLPLRWVTDGQDVPNNLREAALPILAPLGLSLRAGAAA